MVWSYLELWSGFYREIVGDILSLYISLYDQLIECFELVIFAVNNEVVDVMNSYSIGSVDGILFLPIF